jgi:Tol biopolymer transport system component
MLRKYHCSRHRPRGVLAALACVLAAVAAQGAGRAQQVTVHEGTSMALALSPDHRRVAIDLQGVIFVLPTAGGRARRLTDEFFDARQPTWSPDGRQIAFQSNRDGHWRIWVMNADGSAARPLSSGVHEEREPSWAPDGRRMAFTSDRGGKFDIWVMDLASEALERRTTTPGGNSRPSWSPDGREIAYVSDRMGAAGVYAVDSKGVERLVAKADVFSFGMNVPLGTPSWRPGSTDVLYTVIAGGRARLMLNDRVISDAEDVQPSRAEWLSADEFLYVADGRIKRRSLATGRVRPIGFSATLEVRRPVYTRKRYDFDRDEAQPVRGVQRAVLSPDGQRVAFAALGGLWVMTVGEAPRRLTLESSHVVVDPAWSPRGDALVYASDRAGSLDLWIHELASGAERRVTRAPGAEMRPAWSPDGGRIAFVDAHGAYAEDVWVLELADGTSRRIEAAGDSPGYPAWLPDSHTLLVSRLQSYSTSQSYYAGGTNQARVVPLDGRTARDVTVVADRSAGNRSGDGPVPAPDGRRIAFQMDGALWIASFDASGDVVGAPRRIAEQIYTALSWAADSETLLAQVGGRMQLYKVSRGASAPVPLELTWRPAIPAGRTLVHAGRLVDGVHDQARSDVDIIIERNRIVAVGPHRAELHAGHVVDASDLTVMPGLMDMHEHLIKEYGASFGRLLLSYGITTVRSPGNVPGDFLEEREAIQAGQRPGPRVFGTGYILDGERTVWEMGTAVRTREEVARQVELADELDYDLVKTYVHTSEPLRGHATALAHARGIPVASHEIYPAAAFGTDAVEHLDGNGCGRGYASKASQLNHVYDDVVQILRHSGMAITPTVSLFTPFAELAGGDPGAMSTDPRWALQPSWVRSAPAQTFGDMSAPSMLENIRAAVRKLHRAGVRIVVGTDSPFTPIGLNTHNELVQAVKAGLTPFEALRSATMVAAELLGVEADLGSVEPGKLADLVFVAGDPLSDIAAARNVRSVMHNGRLFAIDELVGGGASVAE